MGSATLELALFVFTSRTGKHHAATHVEWLEGGDDFRARAWLSCGDGPLEGVADFLGYREGKSVDCKKCLVKLRRRVREFMRLVDIVEY